MSLGGTVLTAFVSVLKSDFINFDDPFYVINNPHVATGLHWVNVLWAFQDTHLGTWHPITWLSHMLDVQLYGLHSGGHHFTNLLLHTANAVLLFLLLKRITGAFWRSAVVAALFGLHPLHVESVAWISERKDVLSAFLGLLTLWAYAQYVSSVECPREANAPHSALPAQRSSRAPLFYTLTLFLFAFGLMCKPILVTWPVLMLLLDYWPFRRNFFEPLQNSTAPALRLVFEKAPFFALAIVDGLATVLSQKAAGALKDITEVPFENRLANGFISYVRYLGKTIFPTDLAVFYPFPAGLPAEKVIAAIALLLGLSALAVFQARRRPWLLTGWLWYVITLLPVAGFIQVGIQGWADRYTYLPLVGLFLAIAWLAGELATRPGMSRPAIVSCALTIVLAWFGARHQVRYWQSSDTLFRHALAATANNPLAHHCLGSALYERGELEPAIAQFRSALEIRPDYHEAEVGLATALAEAGKLEGAARHFEAALRRKPGDAEAQFHFGNLLTSQGKLDQALEHYLAAVRLKPDYAQAQNNLANALQRAGRIEEALPHYREALRVAPDLAEAHNNLGIALAAQGKTAEAIAHYQAALRSRPDYAEAYNNLGNAQVAQGKLTDATSNYLAAIQHKPGYPNAENSLGCVLAMEGRTPEAIEHFETALKLAPDYPDAHFNLANALVKEGNEAKAIQHFQQALRTRPDDPKQLVSLAEVYANGKQASVRNPSEALRLARRANELTGGAEPLALGTLGTAYAAAGQFTNAVESVQRAIELARRTGQTNLLEALQRKLEQYRSSGSPP